MIKLRAMGTKNELKWVRKVLERDKRIKVISVSEMYENKGTNRYYRMYADVERVFGKQV